MSEALARDGDLTTASWSIATIRDYFLTLIGANDRRYQEDGKAIRDLIAALDVRYEQRFIAQESAAAAALATQDKAVLIAHPAAKDFLVEILNEREVRYDQRFHASQDAVALAHSALLRSMVEHEKVDQEEHRNTKMHI